MNADTAAAIGSICAAVVSIAVVVGQVLLARRIDGVHTLVNGQSHTLTQLATDRAFQRGVVAGAHTPGLAVIPGPPEDRPPAITEPHH